MPRLKKKTKRKFKRGGSSRSTPKSPKSPSVSTPKRKSKKSKKRPSPIKTADAVIKDLKDIKYEISTKLDSMKCKDILELYKDIGTLDNLTTTSVTITPKFFKDNSPPGTKVNPDDVDKLNARKILKINKIKIGSEEKEPDNLYFFKSSGSSRPGDNIEGIYFPLNYLPSVDNPDKTYLFELESNGIRIKKPEDYYKSIFIQISLEGYLSDKENHDALKNQLLKYGRFINEENALISKYLTNKDSICK
tara:strand:+ start:810 stop:1553 length:744 start_codon:yes stop_codon:yes gene_type:complete